MKNIYFIGRYTGQGLYKIFNYYKENYRPYEIEGIQQSSNIQVTNNIKNADIIMFRNKPEKTNDTHLKKFNAVLDIYGKNKVIINNSNAFYNFDSKERSYKLWRDNGLNAPDFIAFDYNDIKTNKNQVVESINQFLKKKDKIFLRTNNETGSKGMFLITCDHSSNYIKKCLKKLDNRLSKISKNRSDSKILAVEFLDIKGENYTNLYRAHVVRDQIICFYVISSTKNQFHCKDMTMKNLDEFIKANSDFNKSLKIDKKIGMEITKSLKVLNMDLGAIEFFIINNKIIFLELNPIWNGHASREGFGSKKFQEYLIKNKLILKESIPNVYQWLDYPNFYRNMYDHIATL